MTGPSSTHSPSSCGPRTPRRRPSGSVPVLNPVDETRRAVLREQAADQRLDHLLQRLQPGVRLVLPGNQPRAGRARRGGARTGPYLYSFVGRLLLQAGISPVPVIEIVLGIIPVAFSVFFFLVPLVRKIRLGRQNDALREEALRRRVMAQVLASPSRVDPREVRPTGTSLDPRDLPATSRRILDRIAASLKAEPVPLEKEGLFAYRFPELERELADLEAYRRGIDTKRYEVGKTVFDSGEAERRGRCGAVASARPRRRARPGASPVPDLHRTTSPACLHAAEGLFPGPDRRRSRPEPRRSSLRRRPRRSAPPPRPGPGPPTRGNRRWSHLRTRRFPRSVGTENTGVVQLAVGPPGSARQPARARVKVGAPVAELDQHGRHARIVGTRRRAGPAPRR